MKPNTKTYWIDSPPPATHFDAERADGRVLAIAATAGLEPDWTMIDAQRRQDYHVDHLGYYLDAAGCVWAADWACKDGDQLRVMVRPGKRYQGRLICDCYSTTPVGMEGWL